VLFLLRTPRATSVALQESRVQLPALSRWKIPGSPMSHNSVVRSVERTHTRRCGHDLRFPEAYVH
jgi:hypothetical protein